MAFKRGGCVVYLALYLQIVRVSAKITDVNIEAFEPKGFRAWIHDSKDIRMFIFQGNINSPINKTDVGTLSGEITSADNGVWVYDNPDVELKVGDEINYYVFVFVSNTGYLEDSLVYTITKLVKRTPLIGTTTVKPVAKFGNTTVDPQLPKPPPCDLSVTTIPRGTACSGEIIFEDDFNFVNEGLWQVEQYIPINHPDYPFVSYQRVPNDPTVKTDGGKLIISAKLQKDLPGFNSDLHMMSLDLFSGCTAPADTCSKVPFGADIIPPVVTGRVTSKDFAFTYGLVNIRAKLPKGDWLYPEIILEPVTKKYGVSNYHSGVIKIAAARGNTVLTANGIDYSNKVLYGGPVMDFQCRNELIKTKRSAEDWGDNFHLYSVRWTPDGISLFVDNEEWGRIDMSGERLRNQLPDKCNLPDDLLDMGSNMAPFDQHFRVTLGLAAGGVGEFPDEAVTANNHGKPWGNKERKAMLRFWQDKTWINSWDNPELVIDGIQVIAL